MDSFKTKKGTTIPLLDLKGKSYLQVAYRILWFREEHPLGRIDTRLIEKTDKYVIYEASISVPNEKGEYIKLSDGVKREDFAHFGDAIEKAQTGAIGRALALVGYGTQFAADELDEGARIVDSPVGNGSSIRPEQPAPGDGSTEESAYRIDFGQWKGRGLEQVYREHGPDKIKSYILYLEDAAQKKGKPLGESAIRFIQEAELFLAAMEGAPLEPGWAS